MPIVDINYVTQDKHVCKRTPSSLAGEYIGNVVLCQCCLFVCVYWEGNTRGQGTRSGAMGGPLTASDLQTHQHATECHSTTLAAPPLLACFVLTCALEGTVSNSAWVTRSHTAQLLSQQSSLESKACLFLRHHTEGPDILEKGHSAKPFKNSNISKLQCNLICIAHMSIKTLTHTFKTKAPLPHVSSCDRDFKMKVKSVDPKLLQ